MGCKFTPGQLVRDGAVTMDDRPDVLDIDAPAGPTCYAQWLDGSIRFDTPMELAGVNSAQFDRDPYTTPDELQFFVSSGRAGGMGGTVWVATRPNRTVDFSAPEVATAFESAGNETKLSMTADGLYAVLGSDRDTANSVDVWEASRATVNNGWSALGRDHLQQVNTTGPDHDPTISADGLSLYLAAYSGEYQYLAVATRADRTANFNDPTEIAELTSTTGDADPSPTPDQRILLFSSNRISGGPLLGNVWYATRETVDDSFGSPQLVPDINTDLPEGDPHLSTDGCRIYFARNLGSGNWDIFVATALP